LKGFPAVTEPVMVAIPAKPVAREGRCWTDVFAGAAMPLT